MSDLVKEIFQLKSLHNAVILAHNYQRSEVQDIADYVGDSLGLAYNARDTDAKIIVFCGVNFMAETAKIVNPEKIILLPDSEAGCSLEQSCPADELAAFLKSNQHKNYYVIAYINCSAQVKALSDIICTSGNVEKIVNQAPTDRPILFVPDENLGSWAIEKTGRKMDLWQGNCHVHMEFTHSSIKSIRDQYPEAILVAHPECVVAVRLLADEICSTEKMVSFCKNSNAKNIIIATESGIIHRLHKECPDKNFIAAPTNKCSCSDCKYMKLNTLQKIRDCLVNLSPRIEMSETLRLKALLPITRMLDV